MLIATKQRFIHIIYANRFDEKEEILNIISDKIANKRTVKYKILNF